MTMVRNGSSERRGSRWLFAALALVIALVGAGYRSLDAWYVFGAREVRFTGDVDVLYHVARSAQFANGEGEIWFDGRVEFPTGARVLWPPGFDATIAAASSVACGTVVERACLERVAAIVPVVWGVATLLLVASIGVIAFGPGVALVAMLLAAILPMNAWWSILGRPDHHVAELFWFLLALLGFERSSRALRWSPWDLVLGAALGLAPWFWQGSILNLAFLGSFLAVAFVSAMRPEAVSAAAAGLMRGAAIGAGVACLPLAFAAPPWFWRPISLAGVVAVQPAALGVAAAWAWTLARVSKSGRSMTVHTRIGAVLLATVGGGLLLGVLFPGAVLHGMRAATATDPFWATVAEARPLLFSGRAPLRDEWLQVFTFVGPALFAPLIVVPWKWREWRSAKEVGPWIIAWGGVVFLALGLRSMRFLLYASPFAALLAGTLIDEMSRRIPRVVPRIAVGVALVALFGYPAALNLGMTAPAVDDDSRELLRWLRGRSDPGHSVLAPWSRGHEIYWYAGAPVVVTPFATDIGDAGTRDFANFLYARDQATAHAILDRRKARFVILEPVSPLLEIALPYASEGTGSVLVSTTDAAGRRKLNPGPGYDGVFGVLLQDFDGAADRQPDGKAAAGLRLVYETPDRGAGPQKVFELVRGACVSVSGLSRGDSVQVSIPVTTNQGRKFTWWTSGRADDSGRTTACQPYATGRNGLVKAGASVLATPIGNLRFGVDEADVLGGAVLECSVGTRGLECGTPQ